MAKIRPFKAVRPPRDKAYLVASRPYYTYKKKLLYAKLKSNKFTFLHVINPEFSKKDKTQPNTDERFLKVKEKYEEFVSKDYFRKDKQDCFYIYRQQFGDNDFIGIIAGASVQEYLDGKIKIHEHTIPSREETFKRYLDICKFNAEPVLLTYPDHEGIEAILDTYLSRRSEYEFTSTDDKTHHLWLVDNEIDQQNLIKYFDSINAVYIADGHHRSASSILFSQGQNSQKQDDLHKSFLAYFIAESKLKIYDYNRIVSGMEDLNIDMLLEKLQTNFDVVKLESNSKPGSKHQILMLTDESFYELKLKQNLIDENHPVKSLDTQILNDFILAPILGIDDIKTDHRVHFVAGTKGVKGLKRQMEKVNGNLAFALFPVSVEEMKKVADENEIMPPKSTWIEPKLRSGLTIYEY